MAVGVGVGVCVRVCVCVCACVCVCVGVRVVRLGALHLAPADRHHGRPCVREKSVCVCCGCVGRGVPNVCMASVCSRMLRVSGQDFGARRFD